MFHRSQRLLLRPGWIEDVTEITRGIADEGIVRNLARVPWPYGEQDAHEWLSMPKQPHLPVFLLTLPSAQGTPVIGACGLHSGERGPEIGYWIARDYWGQGFATEAARALLSIARTLGHGRIHARHAIDNPASGKVLRKAGFVPTGGMVRSYSLGRGEDVICAEYLAELVGCSGNDDPQMPQAA